MASVVVAGDTSGSITIAAPAVAGTNTLTLPANTGTIITTASTFAGTGPAFSASQSANQSIANNTATKIQFNTEDFDTNSCYDPTTNYRFTPNVAGYYQINAQVRDASGVATGYLSCELYKNGSVYKRAFGTVGGTGLSVNVSVLLYFNGSTDYAEVYATQNSGGAMNIGSGSLTYFNGSMVRAA